MTTDADLPVLGTKTLFKLLLRRLRPDLVCDVGSMDASDALAFRKVLPEARILAFEANPANAVVLQNDPRLTEAGIGVVQQAVWNRDDTLTFYVEQLDQGGAAGDIRRGISSTRPRQVNSLGTSQVVVPAVRLDTFVGRMDPVPQSIALWIDVEGGAFEVIEGIGAIAGRVALIHVEVETKPFWVGQRLAPDVMELARSLGFVPLGRGRHPDQHDLVLIRRAVYDQTPLAFKMITLWARLITERLRVFTCR